MIGDFPQGAQNNDGILPVNWVKLWREMCIQEFLTSTLRYKGIGYLFVK